MFPKYLYFLFYLFFLFGCVTTKENNEPLLTSLKDVKSDTTIINGIKNITLYNDSLICNYLSGKDIEYGVIYSIPAKKVNNIFMKN